MFSSVKDLGYRALGKTIAERMSGVSGHVDRICDGLIFGWVKEARHPGPVTIDVMVDGKLSASGLRADRFRDDVRQAGFGDGRFGFECPLPTEMLRRDAVGVKVIHSQTRRVLLSRELAVEQDIQLSEAVAENIGALEASFAAVQPTGVVATLDCLMAIETISETHIRGWAVNKLDVAQILRIDVLIDGVPFCRIANDEPRDDLRRAGRSAGKGGFRANLPLGYLERGLHVVSLVLPDGTIKSTEVRIEGPSLTRAVYPGIAPIQASETAVIVPIYNAADDLRICIARLVAHTPAEAEILLIDDASPDPQIRAILDDAERQHGMRVLRNSLNLGFTRTVNVGIEAVGRKHALLLNSDARVTPGWLRGMLTAAVSRPRVATVTAMSDRAGAFSAPETGNTNELPPGVDEITYATAFRRRALGLYPVVPTGNGFCMFINRSCIDEIGALDAEAFPRGYGEENDFCMRGGRAGWIHVIDDRTYVFHDRSKSFGEAKTDLMRAGRAVIDTRYPEYKRAIRVFTHGLELQTVRMRARMATSDCSSDSATRPRLLFVVSTQTGGTPQTNMDLMGALSSGFESWLMRCDSHHIVLSKFEDGVIQEVTQHTLVETLDPMRHQSMEYDRVVAEWLERYDIDLVHIRHLAWHSVNLPRIVKDQGRTVVFSFHDFYTLCPSVKLMRANGTFYGGDLDVLGDDVAQHELWPTEDTPPLRRDWIAFWRDRFGKALSCCDAFVTTSDSARATVLNYLPQINADRFHVIPHGRDFEEFARLRHRPEHGKPLRILVPGNISMSKGLGVIRDILKHDSAGLIEFHVLGKVDGTQRITHPRLIVHGTYDRAEFSTRVAKIRPHLGAVFSIWDETYCHTLTEMWSVGVPVAVFDFPTVAGRVRASGTGWVLPHEDVPALYDQLLERAFDSAEQNRVDAALAAWQEGMGRAENTRLMGARYINVYRYARGLAPAPLIAVTAPHDRHLDRPYASTQIRLGERTRHGRESIYVPMTPLALLAAVRSRVVDGAILQRNVVPVSMVTPLIAAFENQNLRYALDLDDDLLDVPAEKDPTGVYAAYAPSLGRLVEKASLISVSTDPLRKRMAKLNSNTTLLPNRLSEPVWRGTVPTRIKDGAIRALYFGTVSHSEDFDLVAEPIAEVIRRHPDFRISVVGVTRESLPDWAERIDIPDDTKRYDLFVGWLRAQAAKFDFAIAPLVDTPFNRFKSELKVLDSLALGLPCLASDVGPYKELDRSLEGLTLVRNNTERWIRALDIQIQKSRRGDVDRDARKRQLLADNGLTCSLPAFDELIKSALIG